MERVADRTRLGEWNSGSLRRAHPHTHPPRPNLLSLLPSLVMDFSQSVSSALIVVLSYADFRSCLGSTLPSRRTCSFAVRSLSLAWFDSGPGRAAA